MHELSLLQSLLDQLQDIKEKNQIDSINDVYLSVGEISGVEISFFQSTADLYLPSTDWSHLRFHFFKIPWCVRCKNCLNEQEVKNQDMKCRNCLSDHTETIRGHEFIIQRIEGIGAFSIEEEKGSVN